MDKSTVIIDKPQLAIFLRVVSPGIEVHKELLSLMALKDKTCGMDIKEALDNALSEIFVTKHKIVRVATDSAPAMTGKGLIGLLKKYESYPEILLIHPKPSFSNSKTL